MSLSLRLEITPSDPPAISEEFTPPSLESLDSLLEARAGYFEKRRAAAEEFWDRWREEHESQGAPEESVRNVDRLARGEAFAVVTGQQPGLLGGPLYTPWKILTAILLAARLERQTGRAFVPVFWNAGEDHDTAEMDHFVWLNRDGALVRFEMNLPVNGPPRAFGSRPIAELDFDRLMLFWDEMLRPTEFTSALKLETGQAWEHSRTLGEFCNRLLWQWFPSSGLVILSSATQLYPSGVRDLLEQEIDSPLETAERVNQAAERLDKQGFKPKMHRSENRCSFFLDEEGIRSPVFHENGSFKTLSSHYTSRQLKTRLKSEPGQFSPAANLRPVMQDALLPAAASVVGPGEWAYHLQLGGVYEFHGVPRPALVRRLHVRLLPPRVQRGLARSGLGLRDLEAPLEALVKRVALAQAPQDFEKTLERLKKNLQETLTELAGQALAVDKTLEPVIMKHQQQLLAGLEKLEDRLSRGLRKNNQQLEEQLARLQAIAYPEGKPQERVLNLFCFLNLFGPPLLPALAEALAEAPPGSHCEAWIEHES